VLTVRLNRLVDEGILQRVRPQRYEYWAHAPFRALPISDTILTVGQAGAKSVDTPPKPAAERALPEATVIRSAPLMCVWRSKPLSGCTPVRADDWLVSRRPAPNHGGQELELTTPSGATPTV
jgi:hypothetical protein